MPVLYWVRPLVHPRQHLWLTVPLQFHPKASHINFQARTFIWSGQGLNLGPSICKALLFSYSPSPVCQDTEAKSTSHFWNSPLYISTNSFFVCYSTDFSQMDLICLRTNETLYIVNFIFFLSPCLQIKMQNLHTKLQHQQTLARQLKTKHYIVIWINSKKKSQRGYLWLILFPWIGSQLPNIIPLSFFEVQCKIFQYNLFQKNTNTKDTTYFQTTTKGPSPQPQQREAKRFSTRIRKLWLETWRLQGPPCLQTKYVLKERLPFLQVDLTLAEASKMESLLFSHWLTIYSFCICAV